MTILLAGFLSPFLHGQVLKLVPWNSGTAMGSCSVENTRKYLCYGLEYTPEISGVLTSYTTAFFISCTSKGSPIAVNQSCSMTNNVSFINGCAINKTVLVNSSGNTGTAVNNSVTSGQPIILHQICFTIPEGESITIREDPVTDLTTSIDMANGDSKTEYPEFAEMKIRREITDFIKPVWIDFKSINAGDLIAQLDWTTSGGSGTKSFVIERSPDAEVFTELGVVNARDESGEISSYQFLDKEALPGNNYYRLLQVNSDGKVKYSPVRLVTFNEIEFAVQVSPNPADHFVLVNIQTPYPETRIQLLDPSGRVVIDETDKGKNLKNRLNTEKLSSGLYTVIIESGNEKFSEKVAILH